MCFSRIKMPKAISHSKGRILTKSTHEKRLAQQKSGEKRRKRAITSTPSEEMVNQNAATYVEEQPDIMEGRRIVLVSSCGVFLAKNISRIVLPVVSAIR
jgi:hypothetical protein